MAFDEPPPPPGGGHTGGLDYHRRMVADPERMVAYDRAIGALVRPGDVVLDVGAGSGVLSMLAARHGARVHAVESMPVAELARALIRHNRLHDRVTVHHVDLRRLPPVEPVDLIIGDFMGRWVVDDGMREAIVAAGRWLRPGGRWCPRDLALYLAPISGGRFPTIDAWRVPQLGLDLSPAASCAMDHAFGVAVAPESLLAPGASVVTLAPADATSWTIDVSHRFIVTQPGPLRGLAAWFRAELAPGVTLSTGPGIETHWHQLCFPVPRQDVVLDDVIDIELRHASDDNHSLTFHWSATVRRGAAILMTHRSSGRSAYDPGALLQPVDPTEIDVDTLNAEGARRFQAGDYHGAARSFAAATRAPTVAARQDAPELHENLGLALAFAGEYAAAVPSLLRAVDGDASRREQSARYLVDACFKSGRTQDGVRHLAAYERCFGPHPAGWQAAGQQPTFRPANDGDAEN